MFAYFVLLCLIGAAVAGVSTAASTEMPNIILIVADDLGYGDTSLTGNPTIKTPNLERLASEGTMYTQFTAAASICSPSRAAMLTGRLPIRTGVYADLDFPLDNFFRVFYPSSKECLPDNETTLGEALAGYRTFMTGKWHIGHNPAGNDGRGCMPGRGRQGFDFFFGLPYSHEEGYPGPFPEGLVFPPVPLFLQDKFVEQPFNMSDLTSRYTDIAQFIRNGKGNEQPFFLHMAYENPHVPLFLSDDYTEECKEPSRRGMYGDSVAEMDSSIGKILDALESTGKADNTIVIFTSDNGAWGLGPYDGGSNAPFKGGKGDTNEGGFRVPLIMKVPKKLLKGNGAMKRLEQTPVSMLDLFPTLLDLAGLPLPSGVMLDGLSMRPLMEGTQTGDLHNCLYYWREKDLYAIRCGPHKAHFITRSGFNTSDPGTVHSPPLLYNIEWDTAERIPLDPAENTEIILKLQAAADAHLAEINPVRGKSLYLPQAVRAMPCCPRGSSHGVLPYEEEMPRSELAMPWESCICQRQ
eukprot:GSChrysophyteH2.ASY1.ANO1.46.1 assembled CDS